MVCGPVQGRELWQPCGGQWGACVAVGRKWTLFVSEVDRVSFLSVNSDDDKACSAGFFS